MCGDAHHLVDPRPHEAGGMYGKGIITRHFSVGQVRRLVVHSRVYSSVGAEQDCLTPDRTRPAVIREGHNNLELQRWPGKTQLFIAAYIVQ